MCEQELAKGQLFTFLFKAISRVLIGQVRRATREEGTRVLQHFCHLSPRAQDGRTRGWVPLQKAFMERFVRVTPTAGLWICKEPWLFVSDVAETNKMCLCKDSHTAEWGHATFTELVCISL